MSEPSARCLLVHDPCQVQVLCARPVVLGRVKLLGSVGRCDHMGDLVVPVLAQLKSVPAIPLQHRIPAGTIHIWGTQLVIIGEW